MGRKYAAFYTGQMQRGSYVLSDYEGGWQVIYQDDDEDIWFVELPDARDRETAIRVADALNAKSPL